MSDERDDEIARLTEEMERCRFWNESVRVCANHTGEIVGDGCVICDFERLTAERDTAINQHRFMAGEWKKLRNVVDAALTVQAETTEMDTTVMSQPAWRAHMTLYKTLRALDGDTENDIRQRA